MESEKNIAKIVNNPDLSIIIVNWNTRDLLAQCLESVAGRQMSVVRHQSSDTNDRPTGDRLLTTDIWVVDNASSDGSAQMVRERFPWVRLIESEENVGFARANNQAILASKGEYVLLLNSDTQVLPNSLAALLGCAADHPTAGIIGGKLLNPDGSFQAGGNDFSTFWSELLLLTGMARWFYSPYFPSYPPQESNTTRHCDWVGGACLLARRVAIETVGLLDERYFMYVEEVDWCYRMHQAGWEVLYCAEAPIIHYGGRSAERHSIGQLQLLYASKARFLEYSAGIGIAQLFWASVRLVALVQAIRWYMAGPLRKTNSRDKASAYLQLARSKL